MCILTGAFVGVLYASVIDTTDPAVIAAFQSGATVVDFESITGKTPQAITDYTAGNPVSNTSFVFDQIPGVEFSVGGMVGVNEPALYTLSGGIAGDAKSPTTVLGSVDFNFNTRFSADGLIEIFFPTKVSKVGFWLNPSLGNVTLIAADTNFAFSHLDETVLDSGTGTAGNFVGISFPTAVIGGFKIEASPNSKGFTIDDFTFGGSTTTSTVPEPSMLVLMGGGLLGLLAGSKLKRRT